MRPRTRRPPGPPDRGRRLRSPPDGARGGRMARWHGSRIARSPRDARSGLGSRPGFPSDCPAAPAAGPSFGPESPPVVRVSTRSRRSRLCAGWSRARRGRTPLATHPVAAMTLESSAAPSQPHPAGMVTRGAWAAPASSLSDISTWASRNICLEGSSSAAIQNQRPRYCTAACASAGRRAPLWTRINGSEGRRPSPSRSDALAHLLQDLEHRAGGDRRLARTAGLRGEDDADLLAFDGQAQVTAQKLQIGALGVVEVGRDAAGRGIDPCRPGASAG